MMKDEEEEQPTHRNPYILDDVSGNVEGKEEDDGVAGCTKDERINKYVKSQSCGRKNCPLVSLKNAMVQKHGGRVGAIALYKKLCFFAQVAHWRFVSESVAGDEIDAKRIRKTALDYYSTYKYHFNIQSDDMFEGVHVSIVNFMEYIVKMRINVYEIH